MQVQVAVHHLIKTKGIRRRTMILSLFKRRRSHHHPVHLEAAVIMTRRKSLQRNLLNLRLKLIILKKRRKRGRSLNPLGQALVGHRPVHLTVTVLALRQAHLVLLQVARKEE